MKSGLSESKAEVEESVVMLDSRPRDWFVLPFLLPTLEILTLNTYIALIRVRSKRFTSIVLQYDLEI